MEEATLKSKREDVCPSKKLDLATVQQQLAETKGPEYWRSLEELAGSAEFQEMLHREFPKGASEWLDSVSRRGFLQLMGASLAMAGMTGCTKLPIEEIVPYVRQPEQVIPGRPLFYATAFTLSGYAQPLLVESHLGRPTKIEGNNLHPASIGGTDVYAQASLLGMYDPDRAQAITHLGDVESWSSFVSGIRGSLMVQKSLGGAGMRVLTPTISLADAQRADGSLAGNVSAGEVACVRTGEPRQCFRRRKTRFRAAARDALRFLQSERDSFAGRRLLVCGLSRTRPICARFCQEAQSRHGHESHVRGREHAVLDRCQGRPPSASAFF